MNSDSGNVREVSVELKYCEHCGGLWVRERGTGGVYCESCRPKVADLPAPSLKRNRLILPIGRHSAVEDYSFPIEVEERQNLEAVGGLV